MKTVAKLLAGLSAVLVLALGLAYFLAGRRMGASYEGPIATVTRANLTPGEAGVASSYRTDRDWVRAMRHDD
ncbi:MAG: hypothetical protein HN396_10385 [Gemmatimonadales bacterium]|nr:hypothetical protein [Gemmatimonadales bacterium]MDG2239446.1 hypothetical protein [Longimicrobiales bacterium]NCG32311.1 hypothetical protein [Pseudomonadota bacterium]MBT3498223.1 hypothetical protein [Gemmatimonadales bacterium]MBT3773294.1 hypothetical protein [Gemmatimonadales bacterium]